MLTKEESGLLRDDTPCPIESTERERVGKINNQWYSSASNQQCLMSEIGCEWVHEGENEIQLDDDVQIIKDARLGNFSRVAQRGRRSWHDKDVLHSIKD